MGLLVLNPSRIFARYIVTTVAVFFFLIWVFQIQVQMLHYGLPGQVTSRPPQSTSAVNDIFNFPPIESEAIKSVCAATEWDTGTTMEVVFTCDNSVGGVGNVRNSVLNCVRYAMLAGGSLVMPRIVARNDSDVNVIRTGERRELGYMFDVEHFVESLRLSCPQLRLYNNTDAVFKALGQPRTFPMGLFPESLVSEKETPSTGIAHPEQWKEKLYEWLRQADTEMGPTGRPTPGPFIVELGRSYISFPIYTNGAGFATSFGDILKFRADTRQLATTILRRMAKQFNFESTLLEAVSAANTRPLESLILENAYFGAHLRVERDALMNWDPNHEMWTWSDYGKQATAYIEQAMNANLSLIYVASGETAAIETLKIEAATKGITVIKKQDVLGKDVEKLDKLAWDQQALVDYLVMLKASQFGGVAHSSFAWNVALKRHLFVTDPKKSYLDGPQMLSDEFSQVYGEPNKFPEYAACILGREIVGRLGQNPEQWKTVYAMSRSKKDKYPSNVEHSFIDLTGSADEMAKNLQGIKAEYLFFAAYLQKGSEQENWDVNGDMLQNFLAALEKTGAAAKIKRILLVTGAKQYGVHLGVPKNPMEESDPWQHLDPAFPPNFYYRQQDILHAFCEKHENVSWTVTYPNDVVGFAKGNFMNLATSLGIYAAVAKELGKDLEFPGSETFYTKFDCFTSAKLHAEFCEWAVKEPRAANEAFNVVNGDVESWQNMWPKLARRFGLYVRPDQFATESELASSTKLDDKPPISMLAEQAGLAGKVEPSRLEQRIDLVKWSQLEEVKEAWDRLAEREGLEKDAFEKATWSFLGFVLGRNFDLVISMSKAREMGWTGYADTWRSLQDAFAQLAAEKILPETQRDAQ